MLAVAFLFTAHGVLSAENPRIVFLGDSLTAGYSLAADESFPSLIQKRLDREGLAFTVVNSGISGDTTAGGLRRLNWLMRQPVHILFIALGANDGLRGFDPSVTRSNLASIISTAQSRSPETVIMMAGMRLPFNMGPDYISAFESIYPSLAEEYDIPLLPFLLEGVAGHPELNLEDGMHPNAVGYERIAARVWNFLEPEIRRIAKSPTQQSAVSH